MAVSRQRARPGVRTHATAFVATCLTGAFAATSAAYAQQPGEARIQELLRLAAQQIGAAQAPNAGPKIADDDTRPAAELTLDDSVKLALDRNLNIAVQRLNPPAFDPAIAALRAAYWPTITSLVAEQAVVSPPVATIVGLPAGATGVTQDTATVNAGYTQAIPKGGGTLTVTLNNIRQTSTSTTVLYNPLYSPTYVAQYTQPLLRGRTIDPNRQQILVTKINQDVSDLQLQATIVNTLSSVREAYWNLVYADQAVEVAQQSVALAAELVRGNEDRLRVGTMAPIDVVTAQSQEAAAQQVLAQAIGNRRTLELTLKQLIVSGASDPNWNARLVPIDRPDFQPEAIDLEATIRRALSARTDLATAKKNLEANGVTMKFLRNQLLPQANLVASYGLAGLGGTQFIRENSNALSSNVVNTLPGGIGNALSSLFTENYPQWNVSVNFSIPVGLNVASTTMASAKIEEEQTTFQVRQIELQIVTDVTTAVINIRSDIQVVRASQVAQDLAQKTYDAEQAKFNVGLSTNYNVILELNALNTAKINYLQAVLNYRNALVELDRLQQTTLNTLNVTLLGPGSWNNGAAASSNLTGAAVGSAR